MPYGYIALAVLVLLFACAVLAVRWQSKRTSHPRTTSNERYEEARAMSDLHRHHQHGDGGFF